MSESHKKSPFAWACIFTGGEYEIRTHGGVNHTAFPRLHLKPLGHNSIRLSAYSEYKIQNRMSNRNFYFFQKFDWN